MGAAAKRGSSGLRRADGSPTAANPSYSEALPGAAPRQDVVESLPLDQVRQAAQVGDRHAHRGGEQQRGRRLVHHGRDALEVVEGRRHAVRADDVDHRLADPLLELGQLLGDAHRRRCGLGVVDGQHGER